MSEIFLVHAVDTEGPLNESWKATFNRIEELFGLKIKIKSIEELNKLLSGKKIPSGVNQKIFKKTINNHLIKYNKNWKEIKLMLDKVCSNNFRNKLLDKNGKGWIFSWHCVDHVDYKINPRKRDIGYHKVFDFYSNYILSNDSSKNDRVHFHFHPMSTYKEAHRNATTYINSPHLYETICRRIIERNWFPVANRAGFHVERPDSNLFLEQWIPFDLSNVSKNNKIKKFSNDNALNARGWDWRRATTDWKVYSPSHDDYQVAGNCRRKIGRILSILNRTESIDKNEVLKAFKQASRGKKTLMAVTSHDFRNLEKEVDEVRSLLKHAIKKYPNVKINYCDTADGFRKTLGIKNEKSKKIQIKIKEIVTNKNKRSFKVSTLKGKVFGPQPFLAIKLKNGRFIHDNLDFSLKRGEWFYSIYEDTIREEDLEAIGVGAADAKGNFDTSVIKFK